MAAALAIACVGFLLGLAVLGIAVSRARHGTPIIYLSALIVSLVACGNGVGVLLFSQAPSLCELPLGLPWLGAHFRIDAMSAFFLALVNFGAAVASLYAVGYGRHEEAPGRVLPFYPAFLAGMNLVLIADDAFTFLLSWELMSLASWALVMAHHKELDNARAGFVYLVMASVGTMSLLLTFGLLAGADGDYLFTAIRAHHHADPVSGLVLVLALIGTGSKAGLVPLHVWLPLAHPAAPSHVSALMSGVMTKVAIYGFIRIVMDLVGSPQWWWAVVVLVIGAITAVLGVLHALMEKDIKRLLAYSTVENVGIIFVGLGLTLAFASNGFNAAAALALTSALLHALNHALFKSLLFFGAGAVLGATGERDIERMGGLIHRMPKTSLFMLAGSAAISALPPFNGFVSEWLMFQAVLISPQLPQWGLKFFVPAAGAMLALAAALAAACFVRAYGVAFLGRPRSEMARNAAETDRVVAGRHGVACRSLPSCRHPARIAHRCAGAGHHADRRRAYADAEFRAVAVHRPDQREPQLLQWTAGVCFHPGLGRHVGVRDPQAGDAFRAARSGLGLRLPGAKPGDAIYGDEFRAADTARVWHDPCFGPPSMSTCRRRETRGRPSTRRASTMSSGKRSMSRSHGRSTCSRAFSTGRSS